jgi:hypothetical protein
MSSAAAVTRDVPGMHLGGRGSCFVSEYETTQDRRPRSRMVRKEYDDVQ